MRRRSILTSALVVALASTAAPAADVTPAEAKAIAEEGFIFESLFA